jgi:lipoprotein-anchoring transpeptidase ErfK/SrfK
MLCAIHPAHAQDRQMGGGFIEFLFNDADRSPATGRVPKASQRRLYPQQSVEQQPRYLIEPSYAPRRAMMPLFEQEPQYQQPRYQQAEPVQPAFDPKYEKQTVSYDGKESAGTIVVDTPNKFLYLVQGDGRAVRYGIGVGRPGFTWSGVKTITAKKEWPAWTPPPEMLARRPDLPRHMEGGPANPLGARAMYLGSTLYRIHGSNEPWTIGTNVSSGCIRMRNEDVIDLYGRVNVGARVVVI